MVYLAVVGILYYNYIAVTIMIVCFLDIDECAQNTHDCSHTCVNTIGSFECSCPLNYILSSDLKQCVKPTTTSSIIPTVVTSSTSMSVSTILPTSTPINSTCGGLLTKESDIITTDITIDTTCTWTAKLEDHSKYFHLKIESMELEGNDESCSKCYIEVFNGGSINGTVVGKYCKAQEELIDSAMNEVTIRYSSSGCLGSFKVSYTSENSARSELSFKLLCCVNDFSYFRYCWLHYYNISEQGFKSVGILLRFSYTKRYIKELQFICICFR